MSIEVCVLASGSRGNCAVVRTPGGAMLLDAGIGPRTVAKRMNGTGTAVVDVEAICLTHLDADHFSFRWGERILAQQIRVFCHAELRGRLLGAIGMEFSDQVCGFEDGFEPLSGLQVRPVAVPHDDGSCWAFVIEGFGVRIGYATDLGRVPVELIEHFTDLDLLAIESNYDPHMQLDSARPRFLKQRIMGGRGHLSNQQAFGAVQQIFDRHEHRGSRLPSHVVLLHRSRHCNCPRMVRKLFSGDQRLVNRLTLAEQFERTPWLRVRNASPLVGEQLELGWGQEATLTLIAE